MFREMRVCLGLACLCIPTVQAGEVILSGDSSVVYSLPGGSFGPTPNDNDTFFTNVLGSGTSVGLISDLPGSGDALLTSHYTGLAGVSISNLTGTSITPEILDETDLLFVALPDRSFSDTELSALSDFVNGDGTVFFIGEHGNFDFASNVRINDTLESLGSTLRILSTFDDTNTDGFVATRENGQIIDHPFTAGVSSFVYGGAAISAVSGGDVDLFLETDATTPFVATETIPEPTTLLLFAIAGTMVGRRFRLPS